jgi:hypothetical protein
LLGTLINLPEPGSVLRHWISSAWSRIDLHGQAASSQTATKQAPNVLNAVAINTAIVSLRAGQFRSHLMLERPKTIQRLYEEFEKYCHLDNDFRMCMEEQSQEKKSTKANQSSKREWSNPRNASHANPWKVFGLDGENTQENPNSQTNSQSLVSNPPSPPHSNQGGGRRGGRGGGRGRGRGRGRGHHEKRKWYCIFHKENDDHNLNYCADKKRFEAILEEERKEKERASAVNHSAPSWQNPNFGRNFFANPFHPPQFQPPVQTYTQPPPWQSQTFQAQNFECRPIEQYPIPPPPPPFKGPTAPPMPANLEGQNDPLPSVGTIIPISGGSALEFETKKERKHYFREVRNICVEGRVEKTRWSHIPITFFRRRCKVARFSP